LFIPVYQKYGMDFFSFYNIPYPSIQKVLYKFSIEVWGLIGTLVVYGTPAAGTAAAVLAYQLILFWLPLMVGGIAFAMLRRDMPGSYEFASCAPAIAAQSA